MQIPVTQANKNLISFVHCKQIRNLIYFFVMSVCVHFALKKFYTERMRGFLLLMHHDNDCLRNILGMFQNIFFQAVSLAE